MVTEQNRTEQNRTEQNRTEQNRTEQNRTEQNRTELTKFFVFFALALFIFPFSIAQAASTYTITIPSTLTVQNVGWNELNGGIQASGTLSSDAKLIITASSDNNFNFVKSGDNTQTVSYDFCASSTDTKPITEWEFTSLDAGGTTKTAGINIEDYSNKPYGTYTETVNFTVEVLYSITLTGPYTGAVLVMEYHDGDTWNDMAAKYPTYIKIYSGYAAFYTDGYIYDNNGSFVLATAQIDPNETYELQ